MWQALEKGPGEELIISGGCSFCMAVSSSLALRALSGSMAMSLSTIWYVVSVLVATGAALIF
jgi:hypothetical protein